jgi:Ca2+-binding EF-hand superfamily protein
LHRVGTYKRGAERFMSEAEFIHTLTYSFSFIDFKVTEAELKLLFSEVDLDHDGWISYADYFKFLRFYFGSESVIYLEKINKIEVV